ncbi:hypothetical protein M9Y10_004309 [Tritrichomonas musculus]|uniref:Protein MEMO1 n=1 Tax=Tritrichomonas musculus TaxID=1915356 RepID=A0ABR2JRL8_9EUKA
MIGPQVLDDNDENINQEQEANEQNEEEQDQKLEDIEASRFTREMTHGGEWYPTDEQLDQMMKASFYYAPATDREQKNVVGIIAPHSCYSVCLKTAAKAYARIDPTEYQNIYILGTCHNIPLAACMVSQASEVITPFGSIKVNEDICHSLVNEHRSLFQYMPEYVDDNEHSLEMQYPLIRYVFGDQNPKIIPILVGSLNDEREEKIANILKPLITAPGSLFIISSDFTHWGEIFKFTQFANMKKPLSSQPLLFDNKAMQIIAGFNYDHFRFHIEEIKGSICGCYAICLMLHILNEGYKAEMVDRTQLSQILCSTDFSISYVAIVFRTDDVVPEEEENNDDL